MDPHWFFADSDPAFFFTADPDPALKKRCKNLSFEELSVVEKNKQKRKLNADPDPQPYRKPYFF